MLILLLVSAKSGYFTQRRKGAKKTNMLFLAPLRLCVRSFFWQSRKGLSEVVG
jgi:hypothetical protein